jgi:ATP-dependent helicase/nuclease subunit A
MSVIDAQTLASDPEASVFVSANAGSGKTKTLVDRVARLLLRRVDPSRVLCVTYTKAAAAEMQGRLFQTLGGWSVKEDAELARDLAKLEAREPESFDAEALMRARALFARALETPGGLKIQTIHAFCEKLLRRFPLEAGISPRFKVLEDAAASELSARARDAVALFAAQNEDGPLGRAFAHFAIELDPGAYDELFRTIEAKRAELKAYADACERGEAWDPWTTCGAEPGADPERIEAEALAMLDPERWAWARQALAEGGANDQKLAALMAVDLSWEAVSAVFCTEGGKGPPRKTMATSKVQPIAANWLSVEQTRFCQFRDQIRAARIARDSVHVLTLAAAYTAVYEAEKAAHGGLDFADLIRRTCELLTTREDAAWVLFKLDGGIDHILLDEAQDTAPEQWKILRALTEDLFAGHGARAERGREPPTLFVVGDEKQSIYAFQGARPEFLDRESRFHTERIQATGAKAERVPLHTSYRSTPEVLKFADAAFAEVANARALTGREEPPVHLAFRANDHGSVDLWPLEQDEAPPERDAWDPVDAETGDTARRRLARAIAREITGAVERGEAVHGRSGLKPVGYGDFLILVRKRDALFEEIIRALKQAGAPVAGADRLTLSDHIVFDDFTGLVRWVAYPKDELTLAALLRSPFCAVDEEALFDLAHGRKGDLWGELERRADEQPAWREAYDFLGWALKRSRRRSPFDFLGEVLNRSDGTGRSMRARFLDRLGREAEEAIDELLAQALAAESRGGRDLEGLLAALSSAQVVVKREMEAARDEVRVMTVHGAKGLEAPIVILPDTTTAPKSKGPALLETKEGGFLYAPRAGEDCPASAEARQIRDERGRAESLRLLYVALTRPRDRLILCGRIPATRKGADKGSWRDLVESAFQRPEIAELSRPVRRDGRELIRFGPDPQIVDRSTTAAPAAVRPPAWANAPAPAEAGARWTSPSSLGDFARDSAPSPLATQNGLGRFRRGELIHRLFEVLPDLPPQTRPAAARRLLTREQDLEPAQVEEMAQACLAVLDDAQFAPVFGPGSRAEAALAGTSPELPAGMAVSGRIDRLVIAPDRVLVIDYKTNRPAPAKVEAVDPAYVAQMAAYVAVLRALYPDRAVEAALVWTDGPRLMPLPQDVMTWALERIRNPG